MRFLVRQFRVLAFSGRHGSPELPKRLGTDGWAALFLAAALATLAAAGTPEGGGPDAAKLGVRLREVLLGRPDRVVTCPGCPDERALKVEISSGQATELPLPYEKLTAIVEFPDGKRLLAATLSEKGKRGLLLVLSAESLAPLGRVEIPGIGERVAIAPSEYAAYVLCRRPGRGRADDPEAGDWALLTVDLGASRVAETYPLSTAPSDLALAPDGRLFVALKDRIQSFITAPLTPSWYFRSPGETRRIFVRPRPAEIYALREKSIAIFPALPGASTGKEKGGETMDDAVWVIDPPTHVDRLGFSPDGHMAVAAGRGIDAMLVLDAEKRRIVGTWPEETAAIDTYLDLLDAKNRPRGPRGFLAGSSNGYAPPLQPFPGPPPPPVQSAPAAGVAGSGTSGAAEPGGSGISLDGSHPPQAPPPGPAAAKGTGSGPPPPTAGSESPRRDGSSPVRESSPAGAQAAGAGTGARESPAPPVPPAAAPAAEQAASGRAATPGETASPETAPSPQTGQAPAVSASLEEVADPILSGRITGQAGLVTAVILFGPDSLLTVRAQVTPAPDGAYSFSLPPKGRYRIVPLGAPGTTLSCKPPFQTVVVGEYGYRGLDFRVLGALGGATKRP